MCHIQHAHLLILTHHTPHSLQQMASFGTDSGRQFEIDPISGQVFYHEPMDSFYTPWTALEPSDYHPPRPASHNVSRLLQIYLCRTNLSRLSHRYSLLACITLLWVLKESLPTYHGQHKYLLAFKSGRVSKPPADPYVLTIPSTADRLQADHRRGERVTGELVVLRTTAPERSKFSLTTLRLNFPLARRGGTQLVQGSESGQVSLSVLPGPTVRWK